MAPTTLSCSIMVSWKGECQRPAWAREDATSPEAFTELREVGRRRVVGQMSDAHP
jgi:hypothetical protein